MNFFMMNEDGVWVCCRDGAAYGSDAAPLLLFIRDLSFYVMDSKDETWNSPGLHELRGDQGREEDRSGKYEVCFPTESVAFCSSL